MNASILAMVLCLVAPAAAAQCAASTVPGPATTLRGGAELVKTSGTVVREAGTLVREASAMREAGAMRVVATVQRDDAPPTPRQSQVKAQEEAPTDEGNQSALLWTALALMSGIALRRHGATR